MDELNALFMEVSCSKGALIDLLQGKKFQKWSKLEDMALARGCDSEEYKYLLKSKGHEEILRRKKFLEI